MSARVLPPSQSSRHDCRAHLPASTRTGTGTLAECSGCGRWWHLASSYYGNWKPVRWWQRQHWHRIHDLYEQA